MESHIESGNASAAQELSPEAAHFGELLKTRKKGEGIPPELDRAFWDLVGSDAEFGEAFEKVTTQYLKQSRSPANSKKRQDGGFFEDVYDEYLLMK